MNKSNMKYFLIIVSCFSTFFTYGQEKFTLNGVIKDATNGEVLIGATVYIPDIQSGAATNEYGFFSITLKAGTYIAYYRYLGYSDLSQTIVLDKDVQQVIELSPEAEQLEEVVVKGELEQATPQNIEMSTNKLEQRIIQKIPMLFGEADVIRSILLLPGVSTVGEGASGFNVRGGSVSQNLILQDEAPLYNSSHLFGFFSVFNPDAVKDVKLYKGAIPSRFGGRLASILDVRMKEGNNKKLGVSGGIGTVFSRLAIEAPFAKDRASFIIAARRSYIDILSKPFLPSENSDIAIYFYDITAKTNYIINRKNNIYLSGYFGRDVFKFNKNSGFNWGNSTATFRWNHLFKENLFSNFTFSYSNYDYSLQFGSDNDSFKWKSGIRNAIFKPQLTYFLNQKLELNFGGEAIYYAFNPATTTGVSNGVVQEVNLDKKYNLEVAAYVGATQKIGRLVELEYGLRFSHFRLFGPGTTYDYDNTVEPGKRKPVINTQKYSSNETISAYNNFEPRFSFKVVTSERSSVKGSYNRMSQYLHLISNTTASVPLDVWTPSTKNIKPEIGHQFTLGYFRDIGLEKKYELSAEVYLRTTQNQIDYIDGADLLINEFLEGDILSGKGRAYGIETYFQKKKGKFTGWVSYTLGRSELKVAGINNGEWYKTRYNQTHNLKIAAFYDINERWSVSANFVYLSGTPTTFPTSRYFQQGILIPHNYNDTRNNINLPSYHRLDLGFTLNAKKLKKNGKVRKNKGYWVFSLYNVYSRKNPFSIYFAQTPQKKNTTYPMTEGKVPNLDLTVQDTSFAKQISILGSIVPSVSYNFKF